MEETRNPRRWEPGTTEASRPIEGRSPEQYEQMMGIKIDKLKGRILDLGSGMEERFGRAVNERNPDVTVISLNPDYSDEKYRQIIKEFPDWTKKSVAGIAQELPFKDEVFDLVLELYSTTWYENPIDFPESTKLWLAETVRVLKPGGEAILYPFLISSDEKVEDKFRQLLDFLEKLGVTYRIEESGVPTPYGQDTKGYRLVITKPPK